MDANLTLTMPWPVIGFTSGGFKLALIGIVGLIAWSRIDEHLTKQGEVITTTHILWQRAIGTEHRMCAITLDLTSAGKHYTKRDPLMNSLINGMLYSGRIDDWMLILD